MIRFVNLWLFLLLATGAAAQNMPERSLVRKGNRLYNKGEYEKSIERYQKALEAAPGSFEAGFNLSNALYKSERFDRAAETMRQAAADSLRSDEERAEAFYNLGNAQFKQQQYKEALASYRQSLRLNPSDMEAKYNYAYTKRLLDENQNGGGNDDEQENQQQNQDQQNQQDQRDNRPGEENPQQDKDGQRQDGQQNPSQPEQNDSGENPAEGESRPAEGTLSEQEQEQMLDAIQAQEDKTQDKLKEKQGVVVRGKKNW